MYEAIDEEEVSSFRFDQLLMFKPDGFALLNHFAHFAVEREEGADRRPDAGER